MTNIGLQFNKEYYKAIHFDNSGKPTMRSNNAMDIVLKEKVDENKFPVFDNNQSFKLQTVYPGLLSGSGYRHEIGGMEEEFQLGFFFDHATGLPVIPASSIKGVLRYACEVNDGKYLKNIVEDKFSIKDFNTKAFVQTVFEGKNNDKGISIYQRDIFLDAFPVHSNGALFGSDYITPHKNPLKDPVPIKFLRVQPEVTYQFNFILKESNGLDTDKKQKIFQQIILDLGLGAKTNVGYGQFTELSKEQMQEQKKQEYVRNYEPYLPSDSPINYISQQKIEVTIIDITDTDIAFRDNAGSVFSKTIQAINTKFEKDLKRKRKKNPELTFVELQKDMKIHIRFNDDLKADVVNFTVLPIIKK